MPPMAGLPIPNRAASSGSAIAGGSANRASTGSANRLAKPAVRRLARDLGIDLGTIAGTGPNGTITPTDVAQAAAGEASGRRGPGLRTLTLTRR